MTQPMQVNIPSDVQTTLREMAARNANLAQEVAMLQGQLQTLLNLLTPEQIASLQEPAEQAPNRAARRARQTPKKPSGKAASNGVHA